MQTTIPVQIDFDLSRLSDRILNLFLRGTSEGDRLGIPIVRELYDQLVIEKIERSKGPTGPRPFKIDVDLENGEEIVTAIRNLAVDAINLRRAAEAVAVGTAERADLDQGIELLFCVAEALKRLCAPEVLS